MCDDNDIRRGRHCIFKIHVHLVFLANCRRRVFDGDAINRLRTIFAKVCADFEAQLIEMDGGTFCALGNVHEAGTGTFCFSLLTKFNLWPKYIL